MFRFAVDIGGVGNGEVAQNIDRLVYRTTDLVGLRRNTASNYVDRVGCFRAFTGWHEVQLWIDNQLVV